MPIYEYACHDCGHEFEALVRSSTVVQCPTCHSRDLEKLLSVFATPAASPATASLPASPCGSCPNSGGCGAFD